MPQITCKLLLLSLNWKDLWQNQLTPLHKVKKIRKILMNRLFSNFRIWKELIEHLFLLWFQKENQGKAELQLVETNHFSMNKQLTTTIKRELDNLNLILPPLIVRGSLKLTNNLNKLWILRNKSLQWLLKRSLQEVKAFLKIEILKFMSEDN
jgi:hypothetical protein